MSSHASMRGFTLFETLIATSILVTALAGIAQLLVLGTHLTRQATLSGAALVYAQDKLESLRGLPFAYDADGTTVTDALLQTSPPGSLEEDDEPYVDWIDATGTVLSDEEGAAFVRRWRVSTLGAVTPDAIAIEVCAFRVPAANYGADVCVSTIRSRQP